MLLANRSRALSPGLTLAAIPASRHVRRRSLRCALLYAGLLLLSLGCRQGSDGKPDPWAPKATATREAAATKPTETPDLGDLEATYDAVMEALETPGPYEAVDEGPAFAAEAPAWGSLTLAGQLVERQTWSWGQGDAELELPALVTRLAQLAHEPKLAGLLLQFDGLALSQPDADELALAFADFRKSGKRLACHAEGASNLEYVLLTACDEIALAPIGDLELTGPSAMPIHLRPLLERFQIKADFIAVGAYKGAAEPLTLDAPSAQMTETLNHILDQRLESMVKAIAAARKLAPEEVQRLIDRGLFTSEQALSAKLIDKVTAFEAYRQSLSQGAWQTLAWEADAHANQLWQLSAALRFLGVLPSPRPSVPHVAVVYALGDIVNGHGEGTLGARQEIAARTINAALRVLADDANVKAVVLRIDSGGGSAQASELIWQALTDLRAKKPIIVSMSDVAASGGYYMAAAATKIYALPDTLTGSIGVVGGRLALGEALAAQGVKSYPMGRGKHATMMTSLSPWTIEQRQLLLAAMEEVYQVFLKRVAAGRKQSLENIHTIAQGRVWTGTRAKTLGLVDELGGLAAALAEARTLGGVPADAPLEIYPPDPTLRDMVAGFGGVRLGPLTQASLPPWLAALPHLPPAARQTLTALWRSTERFAHTPIQAIAHLPTIR